MRRVLLSLLAVCCVLSVGVAAVPLSPNAAGQPTPGTAPPAHSAPADAGSPRPGPDSPSTAPLTAFRRSDDCSDDTFVVCVTDTTNYLAPPRGEVVVTAYNDSSLDLSATLAAESATLDGRLHAETLRAAFSAAESDAGRRAVLERYTRLTENRTEALRQREREALREYNDGDLSTGAFVRTLTEVSAAADRLGTTVDRLDSYRLRTPGSDVTAERLGRIRADLVPLTGPVRDHLQSVHAGRVPPARVFVETTERSVVLSGVVERNGRRLFLREAYVDGLRDPDAPNRYRGESGNHQINQVISRASELYPWATSFIGVEIPTSSSTLSNAGIYQVVMDHPHGTLTTFLDGGSDRVFAEYQAKDLSLVPTTTKAKTNETAGLTLTLGRTHESGPLNVTVTDAAGERLDAEISVNNESIGRTGTDGSLWTVTPRSVLVTVTAEYRGQRVTATVFAREQQSIQRS
ncbi:alanine and proline-rich secreted protein Apa [Halomarina litorea]|uniref:alanine and proline-rich secreted protein Apa n=1 Tax=Halomarina litorea TaxID=2961595 RepID=UPI0020C23BCA|nr:alanine and proline-rich secreted protein Apa [Halomarina sp. BCD28]